MTISRKLRFEIFKRDNFTCQYCGRKTPEVILELDHVIPVSKGGTDEEGNLVTSCFECNRGKGATPLNTILKDKDVHEEAVSAAEREMQLREYNYIREEVRMREDADLTQLREHFNKQLGFDWADNDLSLSMLRKGLKVMGVWDLMDHMDTAIEITGKDTRGDYHNVAAAKYLNGIIRNKIDQKQQSYS